MLRSWYERNKHIFPASRWEAYDPEKKWDKYTVSRKLNFKNEALNKTLLFLLYRYQTNQKMINNLITHTHTHTILTFQPFFESIYFNHLIIKPLINCGITDCVLMRKGLEHWIISGKGLEIPLVVKCYIDLLVKPGPHSP